LQGGVPPAGVRVPNGGVPGSAVEDQSKNLKKQSVPNAWGVTG